MKKVFISQPMRGKSDAEILHAREILIAQARAYVGEDIEVLETFFNDFNPDAKPLQFLARSIDFLAQADLVVFGEGWNAARGCKIEHACATAYGIPVLITGTIVATDNDMDRFKTRVQRRITRAEAQMASYEAAADNLSAHGHWSRGYQAGIASALTNVLDDLEEMGEV